MSRDWLAVNRALWDERVAIHVRSRFYDIDGFRAGRCTLRPFEVDELGDVSGRELLHLQCHFGLDTLSWARRGARVTGLDFSAPAVEAARAIARELGVTARFEIGNVYDAPQLLAHRYDIVYTGLGALNWLPDVGAWARVVAACLRPGGTFYLAEFHPICFVFADDSLRLERDYFHRAEGFCFDDPGTYTDGDETTANTASVEWNHPVSDVVNALLGAGLLLDGLHEHDFTLFERWPCLVQTERGIYRLPPDVPRLPLLYSLRATKPR